MITADQIKAARKLLGWSAATLAIRSKRSVSGVAKAESSTLHPRYADTTMTAIQAAFEREGVTFTDDGRVSRADAPQS